MTFRLGSLSGAIIQSLFKVLLLSLSPSTSFLTITIKKGLIRCFSSSLSRGSSSGLSQMTVSCAKTLSTLAHSCKGFNPELLVSLGLLSSIKLVFGQMLWLHSDDGLRTQLTQRQDRSADFSNSDDSLLIETTVEVLWLSSYLVAQSENAVVSELLSIPMAETEGMDDCILREQDDSSKSLFSTATTRFLDSVTTLLQLAIHTVRLDYAIPALRFLGNVASKPLDGAFQYLLSADSREKGGHLLDLSNQIILTFSPREQPLPEVSLEDADLVAFELTFLLANVAGGPLRFREAIFRHPEGLFGSILSLLRWARFHTKKEVTYLIHKILGTKLLEYE